MPADTSSYRTALGLFIPDAEIAMMLYHEPILCRKVKAIPLASCSDPFSAFDTRYSIAVVGDLEISD
jgi:hypothetical protein